ncbi:hypothetical protein AERO8C_20606 [Aeromonas veronii]|uniref:Uncharacterized protein n=1 Tax=Aeromonas veronii TaxID=654 RepID=A0A653L2I6_AERVE|nr:hypothetical protein AERO8C_20606 [Aeromonas veronii]
MSRGRHKGSAIAATYRAAGAASHLDQALAGVQVAERDAKGICCVRLRGGGEFQQMGHHMLHLLLGGTASADYRLLDLGGGVFAHRQIGVDRGDDGAAPGLPQFQGRVGVAGHKDPLDGKLGGFELGDDLAYSVINLLEALRQLAAIGADAARAKVFGLAAHDPDNPVSGDPRTRIDAQNNAHGC